MKAGGQQMPLTHCVDGGQQVVTNPPACATVANPVQSWEVGQQISSRHCVFGGQQKGGTPAAAFPPHSELDAQHAPLAQVVPGGQQIPPSQACPIGQQMPPTASPTHWVPPGQQTSPPVVWQTWLKEQQRPQRHSSPGWQQVPPQKLKEPGLQPVCGWHWPLTHI